MWHRQHKAVGIEGKYGTKTRIGCIFRAHPIHQEQEFGTTMAYKNTLFASLNVTKNAQQTAEDDGNMLSDLMANPEYLRHSSSIINDALKDGFDVLQLPNGDIVTTGTKIITNTYEWDAGKAKLVKARAANDKPRKGRGKGKAADADDADDSEE